MATYVTLLKFTEHGVKNIKASCKRAADFKAGGKSLGIEVKEQYWCLGPFDGVMTFDAADDETATVAMLSLSAHGEVTTQTSRVFTATDMTKIVGKVS